MLADAPHFYQSLPGIRLPPRRMSGLEQADCAEEGPVVAGWRPSPHHAWRPPPGRDGADEAAAESNRKQSRVAAGGQALTQI
jgi:hypothetical protein